MQSLDSIMTIIFAVVTLVVIWKLRSVLGERNEIEKPSDIFNRRTPSSKDRPGNTGGDNVVRLPGAGGARAATQAAPATDRWKDFAAPGSSTARGLDAIAAADPRFAPGSFLDGAKLAYEAIITAFATGDHETLRNLLAKDVYDSFALALADRAKRGETVSTTIVSLNKATIEDASLNGKTARVVTRFVSKLITATHDRSGNLVDGSPDSVVDMNDIWSFARETSAKDPNWKLVATESGH